MSKKERPILTCPRCGEPARITQTKYGERASCCGMWSWHRKELADRDTHSARIQAHAAFDDLWKGGHLSRGECYRRLQVEMGMTSKECHMSIMTAQDALRVVEIVQSGKMFDPRHNKPAETEAAGMIREAARCEPPPRS